MSRTATPFLPDRGRQLAQTVREEIPEERVVSVCRQQPPVASQPRTQPSAKNAPSTISATTLPAATFCTIFTIDRPGIAHRSAPRLARHLPEPENTSEASTNGYATPRF